MKHFYLYTRIRRIHLLNSYFLIIYLSLNCQQIILTGYCRDTAILAFLRSYAEGSEGADKYKRLILLSDCSTPEGKSGVAVVADDLETFRNLGVAVISSAELPESL